MLDIWVRKIDEPNLTTKLELPLDWSEIESALSSLCNDYNPDEQDIYDLQEFFEVINVNHSYPNLKKQLEKPNAYSIINWNEIADQLNDMNTKEYHWFCAYLDACPDVHMIDALEFYQNRSIYHGDISPSELGEKIAEERHGHEMSDFAWDFFDTYEYGQYLLDEGSVMSFYQTPYGIIELLK